MLTDPWGLGYTEQRGQLSVHYPRRGVDGATEFGAGMSFDPAPEIAYRPAGARAQIWMAMLGEVPND